MKIVYTLILSIIFCAFNSSAEEFYKPLTKMKPELHSHYYRAAILTEKKYVLPKYKQALEAQKTLKLIQAGKKKDLPPKEIERLKKLIATFKAWDKLSKLYMKTHLALLAGDTGGRQGNTKEIKGDDISREASTLHAKTSLLLFRFFKENPELKEEKDFKVPLREIFHTTSLNEYPSKSLPLDKRAAVLQAAKLM